MSMSTKRQVVSILVILTGVFSYFHFHRAWTKPPDSQPTPTPQAAHIPPSAAPTPEHIPTPEPTPLPTPEPTPLPSLSIRQIGDSQWMIVVPKGGWHDTGIPVSTNHEVNLRGNSNDKWIVRVNGWNLFSNKGCLGMKFEEINSRAFHLGENVDCAMVSAYRSMITPPDYTTTIAVKITDDSATDVAQIKVIISREYQNECPMRISRDELHAQLHDQARNWVNEMRQKVAIY
jgi:hypothetical protein